MQITDTFYPKRRKNWRNWLSKNHNKLKEIWVVLYKKSALKPTVSYNDAVEEALCFGWIDGFERGIDVEKYAIRFTPRKTNSNWSESNIERVKKLVKAGQMTSAGIAKFKSRK